MEPHWQPPCETLSLIRFPLVACSRGVLGQDKEPVPVLQAEADESYVSTVISPRRYSTARPAIRTRSPRRMQRRSPPRAESCFATNSALARRAAQYGTRVQFAEPVAGSSGIPWRGAKNR